MNCECLFLFPEGQAWNMVQDESARQQIWFADWVSIIEHAEAIRDAMDD